MGLLKAVHRRNWKSAVGSELHKQHGVDLGMLAQAIGPATLDDLLNEQYEAAPRDPRTGAKNVTRVLAHSFGINLPLLAMRAKLKAF